LSSWIKDNLEQLSVLENSIGEAPAQDASGGGPCRLAGTGCIRNSQRRDNLNDHGRYLEAFAIKVRAAQF
jgi:hypothetical protein